MGNIKSYLQCLSLGLTIVFLLAGCTAQTSATSTSANENDAVLDNSNDAAQQILMETEESYGKTTHYIYDEEGKVAASYSFNVSGNFDDYVAYEYDSQDRLSKTTTYDYEQYDVSTGTLRLGDVQEYTTYSYNSDGTYVEKNYPHNDYYDAYILYTVYTLDEKGNKLESESSSYSSSSALDRDLYDFEGNLIHEGDAVMDWEYCTYENIYNDDGTLAEQVCLAEIDSAYVSYDISSYYGKRYTYNADGTVKVENGSGNSKEDIFYDGSYDILYYDEYGNETVDEEYSASGSLQDTTRHTYTYATLEDLLANNSLTVEGL